jgi:hypothetical protein
MDRWEDDRQRGQERQQNLEQLMQPVEPFIEEVATARQHAQGVETSRRAPRPAIARKQSARRGLVRLLSSRQTLRQAIMLNEIIGLPKALRKPGAG